MRPTHVDMFSVVSFAFVDQLTVSTFGGNNNRSIVPHWNLTCTWLLTSCNECSMLPPVWSVTHGSLIVAWRHSSAMSFIGWCTRGGLLTRWMSWCTFYLTTYFSYFTKIFHNQVDYITATFCRCSNFGIKTSNNDLRKIATFWLSVKLSWRHSKFCNCSKLTTPIFLAAYNTNWALQI